MYYFRSELVKHKDEHFYVHFNVVLRVKGTHIFYGIVKNDLISLKIIAYVVKIKYVPKGSNYTVVTIEECIPEGIRHNSTSCDRPTMSDKQA